MEAPTEPAETTSAAAFSVEVVDDAEKLGALAPAWDRLAGPSSAPMQQAAWARACAASVIGRDRSLHVVVAGGPELAAAAALVRRVGVFDRLEMLDMSALGEVADFIYASPADLVPLADALARSRLPLKFDRIRAESPMLHALQQAYGGRAAVLLRPACGSPWIPLDPTWKEPERHLNAGRRSDLRRARRRAAQYGWLSCEVIAPTPNQLPALLDEAFSIEASGWKGRAGTALASDESRASFVRHYAAAACERGILRMCFLRLGGKAAAMQFSVETGGAFWLLKIAYDEAFSKCSPGTLLMVETLRHAAERGLNSYELLGTVEPWTEIWTRYLRPAISVRIYPVSRHGMAALAADMAATARRAVTRAVDRRRR